MYSFKEIPGNYFSAAPRQGSLERIDYRIPDLNGKMVSKHALVYLPSGYETELNKRYNILYLMHGAMGSADALFGGLKAQTDLKNIIDNMIDRGDIEPLIIVTPSYYVRGMQDMSYEDEQTELFQIEFRNILMTLIESRYRTHARSTDTDELIRTRDHRAFGGYSMGSVTTWYSLIQNIDYIKYFMPMSADCWAYEMMGGLSHPVETARTIADAITKAGYGPGDFRIYCSDGDQDFTVQNVVSMMEGFKKFPETFVFTDDFVSGNIHFDLVPGFYHDYPYGNHYIYNSLKTFFKVEHT